MMSYIEQSNLPITRMDTGLMYKDVFWANTDEISTHVLCDGALSNSMSTLNIALLKFFYFIYKKIIYYTTR